MDFKIFSIKLSIIFIILFFFNACMPKTKEQKEWEKYAEEEIIKRIGKSIYIPDSILYAHENLIDTLYLSDLKAGRKIATYIDIGCSACLNNFGFWNKFIEESKSKNIHCDYLIYINGNKQTVHPIRQLGFHHPLLLDTNSVFIQKNSLWDKRFQTALLNEKNEVIIIGDPTVNEKLKDLYMDALLDEK
jgi:hypothetical protein